MGPCGMTPPFNDRGVRGRKRLALRPDKKFFSPKDFETPMPQTRMEYKTVRLSLRPNENKQRFWPYNLKFSPKDFETTSVIELD